MEQQFKNRLKVKITIQNMYEISYKRQQFKMYQDKRVCICRDWPIIRSGNCLPHYLEGLFIWLSNCQLLINKQQYYQQYYLTAKKTINAKQFVLLFSLWSDFSHEILNNIDFDYLISQLILIAIMLNSPQNQNMLQNQFQPHNTFQGQHQPQQQQDQYAILVQNSYYNLVSLLDNVHQLQKKPYLQNLAVMLKWLQVESTDSMNRACSTQGSFAKNESVLNLSSLNRFKAIKQKNQELLIRLMNLRQKILHNMYMYRIRSPKTQAQLQKLGEKIRHLKVRVNNKYSQLKFMKMSKDDNKINSKQQYTYSPLSIPLNDLRTGAEIVEKQSIRLREQLNLVLKYLHGEQA